MPDGGGSTGRVTPERQRLEPTGRRVIRFPWMPSVKCFGRAGWGSLGPVERIETRSRYRDSDVATRSGRYLEWGAGSKPTRIELLNCRWSID